jgi:proline dehydrogenase
MSAFDRVVGATLPLVPKPIVGYFSRPYIAGSTMTEAVAVVRRLNAQGMMASLDVLGENITSPAQADAAAQSYLRVLEEISKAGVDSNVSIKLTQLGLKIDPEGCFERIHRVVARAQELGNFVRIDMEDSTCTTETLEIHRRLRRDLSQVGLVLQAMLRRTLRDADELAAPGGNIRLCKGIYVEPRRIAYRDQELINRNYTLVLERLLSSGCYVGIATHDEKLVWEALRLIRQLGLTREQYEFQMLLGVDEELRGILVDAGHRLRVYVPFGEQWYAYSVRRLRENPRIAGHVARSVLARRRS